MSETGLTEKELRNLTKYRILLSQEQNIKGNKTYKDRYWLSIRKSITKKLQLPKEHPLVHAEYLAYIEHLKNYEASCFIYTKTAPTWSELLKLK